VTLVTATRRPKQFGIPEVEPYIEYGASPRGSIYLVLAARALAVIKGRDYVMPGDVEAVTHDVLRHRILLSYRALAEDVGTDDLISRIRQRLPAPRLEMRERAAEQP
jgi:MoxR-like ATPase